MRVLGISSVFLLTACILSFSLTGAVNAQTDQAPLSVETDYPGYSDGSEINISGKVRDSSLLKNETPILLRIISADGASMVGMAQLDLDSNNEYSHTLTAGGPLWKTSGDYTIKAQYGAQKGEAVFTFTTGGSPTTEPQVIIEEPVIEEPVIEEPVPVVIEEVIVEP